MADALKAEGNKAFAEKKFEEAMYVPIKYSLRFLIALLKFQATNSPKLLSWNLQIMFFTPTDPVLSPH